MQDYVGYVLGKIHIHKKVNFRSWSGDGPVEALPYPVRSR